VALDRAQFGSGELKQPAGRVVGQQRRGK